MSVIPIPQATKENLKALDAEIASAQRAMNAIVITMRQTMNIPDTWTLTNLERGFVPPAGEIAETGDPNHE